MLTFTSDQWVILALVFVLGLLIGAFLLAGSGRKWKRRYRDLDERHQRRTREFEEREKEWRERDSLRAAALKDRDRDADGVPDSTEY